MTLTTRTNFAEASGPHVSFAFMRSNPPHYGHKGVISTVSTSAKNGAWALFFSKSQDSKKNPLDYQTKLKWIYALYPETKNHIVEDPSVKTFLEAATYLYNKGFRSATFIAGEDDIANMRPVLEKYNNKEMGHGFYSFNPLTFMESPRLTSATNARQAAKDGDPDAFERATQVPQNLVVDGKTLFQTVRLGLNLPEDPTANESFNESMSESAPDVNYGIGKKPSKLFTIGDVYGKKNTKVPHAYLHTGKNKKRNKKLGIPESINLTVDQLAHISDKVLDDAYHYGLSTPGNNFGWLANIESATAAKRMIDSGITDIEAIANAIHDGWNKTAVADYMGKLQLDIPTIMDKKKKRYALAQQTYAQLPEVEKEKDRVVARAMLKAMGIVTEAPGIGGDWGDNPKLVKRGREPYKPNVDDTYYGSTHGIDLDLYGLPKYELDEDLTPDQWAELRITDPKAYMGNKDYANRRWWTLEFKKARAAAREKGAQRFEFPPGSKNSYMVAPDLANEGKVKLYTDPDYFGAEVDDSGFDSLPIINIPTKELVGFEPDTKMKLPKAQANVAKIIDGLEKNENIPPILVRKYKGGYQVLDGHHRFWAYKTLKKDSIPARLVPDSDIEEISKNKVNEATEKSTKAEAKYQAMPRNGQRCDHCTMWRPPHGCSAVSGKIAANGWCSYYKRSHRKDLDEALLRNDMYGGWIEDDGLVGYVNFGNGHSIWDGHIGYLRNAGIISKYDDVTMDAMDKEMFAQDWVRFITDTRGSMQSLSLNGNLNGLRKHYRIYAQTVLSMPAGSHVYIDIADQNKNITLAIPEQKREFMKLLGPQSQIAAQPQGELQTESQLDEAASPVLFHYTRDGGAALDILRNNEFKLSISTGNVEAQYAPKGYEYFLSTTRSKVGGYHELTGDYAVMFNLDGNWFNRRYPSKAIDYWAGFYRGDRHSESEDRIFSREPTMPADAITAVHILLKERGDYISPEARSVMIAAKKRGLPTYLYTDANDWRLQNIKKAVPVSGAQDLLRGQKITSNNRVSEYGKRMLEPWLELLFKKKRSELSKRANDLRYSLTYYTGGQFSDDLGLRNEISNARKPGSSGYPEATKIIAAMRKIGANNVKDLLMFLHKKWDAEALQKESVEEALDTNETHGWILPNRKVVYVGSEEHLSWLYDNDIDGYEEAFTQGYVRFVNLPNTFFLEGTLSGLKKLYRVYAASALSRPHIAVDVYDGNRGNATSSHDFTMPQEKTKFMQLLGPSSVGEHAGSIIGTVGGGNDYPDRQVAVFPWDRWVQPDTGNSKLAYVDDLDEVNMSPSSLAKFAATPQAQAMTIGFEAEMLVPGLDYEDEDADYGGVSRVQYEFRRDPSNWDLSRDAPFPTEKHWAMQVAAWASKSDMLDSEDVGNIRVELRDINQNFIAYVAKNKDVSTEIVKPENLKWIANYIDKNSAWMLTKKEIKQAIIDNPNASDRYTVVSDARKIFIEKMLEDSTPQEYEELWKAYLKRYNIKNISDWFMRWGQPQNDYVFYPFLKGSPPQDSTAITVKELAVSWKAVIGAKVKYGAGYHGLERDGTSWILEPDSSISGDDSGIELISPPMPLQQGMAALDKFFQWAGQNGYYGNESTGFHVGVSLPEELQSKIDPLKVVMLLGDQYVLDLFDRGSNEYTKSSLGAVQKLFKSRSSNVRPEDYAKELRNDLARTAQSIVNRVMRGGNKYVSVHLKSNYIEFRSAGGNFMEHIDDIKNTVLRYVQVMAIAADPQAYREEYAKKLYKIISKNIPRDDDQLSNFAMYASGLIDQNVLKMRLQKRHTEKADAAARAAFVASTKIYRVWLGDPPYGSNLSDPKRFATPSEAYAWAKSYANRLSSTFDAKSLYLEPDDHSIPPIVLDQPASGAWLQ